MKGVAIYIGPDLPGKEISGKMIGFLKSGQLGIVDAVGVDSNKVQRAAFSIVDCGRPIIMHIPVSDLEFCNYLFVQGPTSSC